jgi:RNA polymerase sigma-70 factor (ECF subfamily)
MVVVNSGTAADVALLDRIARRDPQALADLYDRHSRLLFSLILRILRDRGEAEDALQEVFVRVWERAETYSAALGTPLAWLVRVSRNRAIDRLRIRQVRASIATVSTEAPPAQVDGTAAANPEQQATTSEQQRAIALALDALPADQRALIESAFYEGYTQSELAERFNLPLGTVKTRIRTGMQALRKALGFLDGGERS